MIRSLVLDYGNVISKANTGDCAVQMERMTGVPAEVFGRVYEQFRFEFDRGIIDGAEMYRRLLVGEGYTDVACDNELMKKIARLDLESWRPIKEDVCNWALNVQKSGYKLGILSNMPYEFLDLYEKEIPPFVAADYACFSCRLHLIKPEPEIYLNCLEGLGISADEAVFFDDMERNIEAAQKLGFRAFVWTGLAQAQKDWLSCL